MTKLYIAYGSNMNAAQMKRRCPAATPAGVITIDDARLVFRGVADIEFAEGASLPVVLWNITEACERSLDKFEGVASGVYEKKMIPLDNGEHALVYVMCSSGIAPPTREYYGRIAEGYHAHGIDLGPLEVALKHSHVKTEHTRETRRRLVRNISGGNVQIARRPMHVPLSAVGGAAPLTTREAYEEASLLNPSLKYSDFVNRRWSEQKRGDPIDREHCHHDRLAARCILCEEEQREEAQGLLPLPKPDPRYDGYNWSEKAKAGSRKKNRVVYEDRESFGSPAERAAHIQAKVRANSGKNKRKQVTKHRNLSDYMKEKGYTN